MRVLFNVNPLLKLDGYYLLRDLAEIANLRRRAFQRLARWCRSLLRGAPRPERERCAGRLLFYGLAAAVFSAGFLVLALVALHRFLSAR